MSKTVTSAVLSVITSYDKGAGNSANAPYAVISLNDYRLYDFRHFGALDFSGTYLKFVLGNITGQPVNWSANNGSYAKCTYQVDLLTTAYANVATVGTPTYTEDTSRTRAFDDTSLESLLQTLTVSCVIYSSQNLFAGTTDGLGTAKLRIYAAYVDVTYDDSSTQRFWATGATEIVGGAYCGGSNGFCPGPGVPTTILDADNATDEDTNTYAEIQATNKITGLTFSPLWNADKLVLDWQMHADCGNPPDGAIGTPYSHTFTATGGTEPYSWAVTDGALPDGLELGADGTVDGTPTKSGEFEFTLTVTDSGTTDTIIGTAQGGGAGMSMGTLTVGTTVKATASSAAYMGVNSLGSPYWAIAVQIAPPDPVVSGEDSYLVTVEACKPDGTALPDVGERDFYSVAAGQDITAQTLLGNYQPTGSVYTAVKFRLYAVDSGGVRTLKSAWSSASSLVVTFGNAPAASQGTTMGALNPSGTTAAATASAAVDMGVNSIGQHYWSIAAVVRAGAATAGVNGYLVTVQNCDSSGTAGGDNSNEKDFYYVPCPSPNALMAQNLLGLFQTSPTSTFHYIKFRLYAIAPDLTRTLVTGAWGGSNQQIVNYGTATGGAVPAPLPRFMTASITCTIKILAGDITAACGTPGIVPLGQAFSFRPTVTSGELTLGPSYDSDGTLTWVVTGLPPGLTWDNTSGSATYGHIAGTATAAGTYNYTATITTSKGQVVTLTCPLEVEAAGFDASCGTPPVAVQDLPYSFQPPFAVGSTYSDWTFTGLPPGLSWDTTSGTISGVPTQIGTFTYHASKTGSAFDCTLTVAVQGDSGQEKCGPGETAIVGEFYTYVPPFTSEAPIASWVFTGLAPGLVWDTDPASATYGKIAGIPSAEGGWGYHAVATLTDGTTVTRIGYTCSTLVKLPGSGDDSISCVMLDLSVWQPLFEFTSLQQVISLPPAYQRALRYQLALELAPAYGRSPEVVAGLAAQAIADVDSINLSNAAGIEDMPAAPQETK